jgi:UDP-glucose 4-epimerase
MSNLVIGATGFVGMNLAEALLGRGEDVVLFDRGILHEQARRALDRCPGKYHLVHGDVTDPDALAATMQDHKVHRVFYGAAITSGPDREREDPARVLQVNLIGMVNAAKAAADNASVSRFLNISSASAYGTGGYGDTGWDGPLDEYGTRAAPNTLYAISKFATEHAGRRLAELTGLDVRSVRLSAIFGPWEVDSGFRDTLSSPMQASLLAAQGKAATFAYREARDWTYSRDVATALMTIMDADQVGNDLYNVSCGRTWSTMDWCERLAQTFPNFSYRLAKPGETPSVNLHGSNDRIALAPNRLRDDLGYQPSGDVDALYADFAIWQAECGAFWSA